MRLIAPLIGTLLLVGFVLKYWVLIALVLTAVAVWKYGPGWWARHQATAAAQRRRLAAIAARADQQHQWTLVGDPRGTYGHPSWRIQAVLLHTQCEAQRLVFRREVMGARALKAGHPVAVSIEFLAVARIPPQ